MPSVIGCSSFYHSKCFTVFQFSMGYAFFDGGFQILVSVLQGM